MTPRLTLNLGIRWQLTPFTGEADQIMIPGFDKANHAIVLSQPLQKMYDRGITLPAVVQAYQNIGVKFETWDQAGVPQKMAHDNWRDWGPHVGLAYRFSDGPRSFVLRGGLSKSFYNEGTWVWMDQSAGATPFSANFTNTSLTSAEQSPDGVRYYGMRSAPTIIAGQNSQNAVSTDTLHGISAGNTYNYFFNPNQPTNYVWDYNVTLEREILADTVLRAGFVGNHAGNQMQGFPFNDPTPDYIWYKTTGLDLPGGALAAVARNPYDSTTYGPLVEYRKTGYSNFNGAQFVLERRHSKGFSFQIAYVVGNAFRNGPGDSYGGYANMVSDVNQYLPGTVPADPDQRNRMLYYARDYSYPKHKVRWNFLVDLPFGQGKAIGRNLRGVANQIIGGWQVAGLGSLGSTYLPLTTSYYNFTGAPLEQYGYKYPIQDCRSGTCYPGYLWYNGYIPSNLINSHDASGNPNGVMGVPENYKPAVTPLIPWGTNALPANAPSDTNIGDYWDTNTVWVPLKDGTTAVTDYAPGLNAWQNQYIPGPLQWNQDLSLFKRFRIREGTEVRFTFDAFNVFNHPNNDPSGILGDGIMNTSYQANVGRELQLSLRLTF